MEDFGYVPEEVAQQMSEPEKKREVPKDLTVKFEESKWNERMDRTPNMDTLVVCGKSFFFNLLSEGAKNNVLSEKEKGMMPGGELSVESKMAAVSAGLLYLAGKTEQIIFTGGKTAGEQFPSEAQAMKDYMKATFQDAIPDSVIRTEDQSLDTVENAKAVKGILEQNPDQKVGYITVDYHLQRARETFSRQGLGGEWMVSNEILDSYSGHNRWSAMENRRWEKRGFEKGREALANSVLRLGLDKVLTDLSHKFRGK